MPWLWCDRAGGRSEQLEADKTIERAPADSATHSYEIALLAEQYLSIAIEAKHADLSPRLLEPDGALAAEARDWADTRQLYPPATTLMRAAGEQEDIRLFFACQFS